MANSVDLIRYPETSDLGLCLPKKGQESLFAQVYMSYSIFTVNILPQKFLNIRVLILEHGDDTVFRGRV